MRKDDDNRLARLYSTLPAKALVLLSTELREVTDAQQVLMDSINENSHLQTHTVNTLNRNSDRLCKVQREVHALMSAVCKGFEDMDKWGAEDE